jgi:hypothetical protein
MREINYTADTAAQCCRTCKYWEHGVVRQMATPPGAITARCLWCYKTRVPRWLWHAFSEKHTGGTDGADCPAYAKNEGVNAEAGV